MGTVFQAFGILALVVLLVVVIAVAVIVWKVKRFLKGLGSAMTPDTIKLAPDPAATFEEADRAQLLVSQLVERGFLDAGLYRIPALGNLVLRGLVKPADGSVAAIYEHPMAGLITDVVTRYPDKKSITVTSSEETGLDTMPGKTRVNLPGADAAALYDRMLQERPAGKAPRRYAAAEFAPYFEQAYADEMTWRKSRGGATAKEIRNVAAKSGRELSDDEVAQAQDALRRKEG